MFQRTLLQKDVLRLLEARGNAKLTLLLVFFIAHFLRKNSRPDWLSTTPFWYYQNISID